MTAALPSLLLALSTIFALHAEAIGKLYFADLIGAALGCVMIIPAIYYITLENENYEQPDMPEGVEDGIIRGMYKFRTLEADGAKQTVNLFGSGAILNQTLKAQQMLAEQFQISSNVWSVTSYTQLRRDAHACRRWNMLHPDEDPKKSYVESLLENEEGVFVSASDYVRALGEQIMPWVPGDYYVLGTDGMGRSETRPRLRRHFEVDAESVVLAALWGLQRKGQVAAKDVAAGRRWE